MTVVPFPTTRFTRPDVAAIVDLCYRLTTVGTAGGWARHTSNSGADVLQILNPLDDRTMYSFDRAPDGQYRVWNGLGDLLVEEMDLEAMLRGWHLAAALPPTPANLNRPS